MTITQIQHLLNGQARPTPPLIQKAVDILEELWIDYMMNGKVNPGSGIFLGKNLFTSIV